MQLVDIGHYGLVLQWMLLLWIGGCGIVVVDFFLSAWRNRDSDLRSKSYVDELTQLLNRRAILEGLEEEYSRALRVGYPISVAIIDLDFFKKVNDSYGHPFGDVVLKGVAKEIAAIGRKNDLVGRYGGEEFIAVFPECDSKAATGILERLRESVEALMFETPNGGEASVTISVGVAQQESTDEEYLQLIARADFALYRAKEFGRNQVLSIEIEDNEQLAFLSKI
jgi:diguanylate cyclase (GGDEF)-like protein